MKTRMKINMSLISYGKKAEEVYELVFINLNHLMKEISRPEYHSCLTCRNCRPGAYTSVDSILDIGFISRQTKEVWIACEAEKLNRLLKTYCQKWENLN